MSRNLLPKLLFVIVPASLVVAPAAASAKAHNNTASTSSCSAASVSVGSTYTVNGSGLLASSMVQFLVTDSSGAESSTTALTDASGSASVSGHAWVAGTDQVAITTDSSPWTTLATCSFTVS